MTASLTFGIKTSQPIKRINFVKIIELELVILEFEIDV